jgi:hypothetical protein
MPAALGALAPAAVVPAPVLGANEPEAMPPTPEPLTIVPTAPLPLAKIGRDIIEPTPTPALPPLTLLAQPANDSHPAMPITRSPTFNEHLLFRGDPETTGTPRFRAVGKLAA